MITRIEHTWEKTHYKDIGAISADRDLSDLGLLSHPEGSRFVTLYCLDTVSDGLLRLCKTADKSEHRFIFEMEDGQAKITVSDQLTVVPCVFAREDYEIPQGVIVRFDLAASQVCWTVQEFGYRKNHQDIYSNIFRPDQL